MKQIIFNKKKKGGENNTNYDFTYIYAPYEYILLNYSIINNKLKNINIKNNQEINYYFDFILYLFLICILIYLLYYIYYYKLLL